MRKVVAVAGGFDPIHGGHLIHLLKARALAGPNGKLFVITHNDDAMVVKKGYCFMPMDQRVALLLALRCVDRVVVAEQHGDHDGTVAETLVLLHPDIFAKGGDRQQSTMPQSELDTCQRMGIELVFGVGDQLASSQDLVLQAAGRLRQLGRV
mgnify:CR=1 FL=1